MLEQDTITYFENRRKQLDADYQQIQPLHKELSALMSPWSARFNLSEIDCLKSAKKIIDSIPYEVRRTFRSGMASGVTNEAENWFRLSIFGLDNVNSKAVRDYLGCIENLFRAILSASAFYSIQPVTADDFSVFGLGCYAVNVDRETVVSFLKIPVGSFRYEKDSRRKPVTFCRNFMLSASEIKNLYGEDNISDEVKKALKDKRFSQKFELVQFVEQNANFDKRSPWAINKRFISVVYEPKNKNKKQFLEVSGFDYMPFVIWSGDDNGENAYPVDSCGINALPDLRQLFSMIKDKMKAIKKQLNPALKGPANIAPKTTEKVNEYYENSKDGAGVEKAYDVTIDLSNLSAEIEKKQENIRRHFYNDVLAMIISLQDKGQRTAHEISELKEEKISLIAPALNQEHEAISQLFDILFEICDNGGLLPEPPEEIQGMDIKVELVSTLAQAQKAAKLAGIERVCTLVGNLSEQDPYVRNKINLYNVVDVYADFGNVPPEIINSTESVEEFRAKAEQAQAQQQQQEQLLTALEKGSKIYENVGGKDLSGGALAERFGY